jgi:hypothetical protein
MGDADEFRPPAERNKDLPVLETDRARGPEARRGKAHEFVEENAAVRVASAFCHERVRFACAAIRAVSLYHRRCGANTRPESKGYSVGGLALEQSIIGETLNLAARLETAAGPGEIIISEPTRRLCGGMFEYEQTGDIVLKGFPEPVTIYRLLGEGSAQSRFDARTSSGLNPFVGRDQEFDALLAHWGTAREGRWQIVHVRAMELCGSPNQSGVASDRPRSRGPGQPFAETFRRGSARGGRGTGRGISNAGLRGRALSA